MENPLGSEIHALRKFSLNACPHTRCWTGILTLFPQTQQKCNISVNLSSNLYVCVQVFPENRCIVKGFRTQTKNITGGIFYALYPLYGGLP